MVYHTVGAPGNHNYVKNNCRPVLAGPWQASGHQWITWVQRTHSGPFAAKSAILRGQHHRLRNAPVASRYSAISFLLSNLTGFLTDGKKAVFIWHSRPEKRWNVPVGPYWTEGWTGAHFDPQCYLRRPQVVEVKLSKKFFAENCERSWNCFNAVHVNIDTDCVM